MNIFDKDGFIDSDVQDILYELGNVGLGMASITVGRLMGLRVHIGVPRIIPASELLVEEQHSAGLKAGILFDFQVSMKGSLFFALDEQFVNSVIERTCVAEHISAENMDESEKMSVLSEFANMIAAAYLKAIGQYSGMRIFVKPVWLKIESSEVMMREVLDRVQSNCEKAISVDASYSIVFDNGVVKENVGGMVMLPDEDSVKHLIEPLMDEE